MFRRRRRLDFVLNMGTPVVFPKVWKSEDLSRWYIFVDASSGTFVFMGIDPI